MLKICLKISKYAILNNKKKQISFSFFILNQHIIIKLLIHKLYISEFNNLIDDNIIKLTIILHFVILVNVNDQVLFQMFGSKIVPSIIQNIFISGKRSLHIHRGNWAVFEFGCYVSTYSFW